MTAMARRATGRVDEHTHADGDVSFAIRFPYRGRRPYITLGTLREGWTRPLAEAKLREVVDLVRAGMDLDDIFPPAVETVDGGQGEPTLAQVAERQLANMRADAGLTDSDPDDRTIESWRWATKHLLPTLGHLRPSELTIDHVDQLRRHLVRQRTVMEKRARAGHPVMETRTRPDGVTWRQRSRPLSDSSINRVIDKLATLLDIAMEDPRVGPLVNVARGKRRKLTVKTPTTRTYLEPEQVVLLLDAAKAYEARERVHQGVRGAPATAIIGCLVMGGQRISEVINTELGAVNLGAMMMRAGGKTAAGMGREIDIVFDVLIDLLGSHIARHPGGLLLFPSHTGTARSANNIRRMLDGVVAVAERLAADRGVASLGKVTPHALRRTNISLLSAAGYDPGWIMAQVGHTDPKLTLRIYNQVLKRKRSEEFRQRANELLGARPAHTPTTPTKTFDVVPVEWASRQDHRDEEATYDEH